MLVEFRPGSDTKHENSASRVIKEGSGTGVHFQMNAD